MIDRRLVQHFDWILLTITVGLQVVGLVTLYSAATTSATLSGLSGLAYVKQTYWLGFGFGLAVVMFLFSYRSLYRWAFPIYLVSTSLLVAVGLFGKTVSGSQRWLSFGGFSFQPSELAKISIVIFLARYFSDSVSDSGLRLQELWRPLLFTLVLAGLIIEQPDLGTGLMVMLIAASMTLFVKVERRALLQLGSVSGLACVCGWFFLKDYQRQRIFTFLNPEGDPLGAGYHVIQSKIAVGSGMLAGKGFLRGTQNALSFLPEQHTDFIFSVFAEEWGFVGVVVVLVLYFLLIAWGLNIATRSKDPFGTILAVGVTSMIFWQVVINIGMTVGLLPVVGVTLPLISYGGSSLLITMTGIGILLNISMRRFMFTDQ